jgi:hypothetical protein
MSKKRPIIRKEYMEVLRPCLHFHGIQIKSAACFREFADAVSQIEQLVGIHEVTISMEDIFVCPDIDLDDLICPSPMETLLIGLIKRLSCKGRDR